MGRPASQLYVGIAAFDVANRRTRSAGCKRCNTLVKVDRVVYGCADLNDQDRIRSSRRFDSNPIYQDRIRSEFSTRIGSNFNYHYYYHVVLLHLLPPNSGHQANKMQIQNL